MTIKTMAVPLDPRYDQQNPMITTTMKKYCNGEFTMTTEEACPVCYHGMDATDVDCMCGGSDDQMYERKNSVPWDLVKDIYKKMATMANGSPEMEGDESYEVYRTKELLSATKDGEDFSPVG